jgi:hypothetical protein
MIWISYFLPLSHVAMLYATTEQKSIHSILNALRIRRKINQLHQSSFYTSSIYYTTQNNPWICRNTFCRFNGTIFLIFFCITSHTCKILKSTVEFHTSKNILKMIKKKKQPITPSFVLYIEYTLNYTFIHFGTCMSISCKQGSLLISKYFCLEHYHFDKWW